MKTSEFWVALASALLPIALPMLNAKYGWDIPIETVLGLVAYILGRSGVKVAEELKAK